MPSKPRNKKTKRKNTSLRLEESVLKKLKIYAVKKDTSVQQIIEDLVVGLLKTKNNYAKNTEKSSKIGS